MSAPHPIPDFEDSPGYSLASSECRDEIVTCISGERIWVVPIYHQKGIAGAEGEVKVRQEVSQKLLHASEMLPQNYGLVLYDGLRTLKVQQALTDIFLERLEQEYPDILERKRAVELYCAKPPNSRKEYLSTPPPHSTGGAVDVLLCDNFGNPLEIGAEFDECSERSKTTYYEDRSDNPEATHNRRLLFTAMTSAGFAPYPEEFWHYEYGTKRWAASIGKSRAIYEPVVPWEDR